MIMYISLVVVFIGVSIAFMHVNIKREPTLTDNGTRAKWCGANAPAASSIHNNNNRSIYG